MERLHDRPPVEATLDPVHNEIHVRKGAQLLTLTFPEVRKAVADIAKIYDQVERDRAEFAAVVRGPKGARR